MRLVEDFDTNNVVWGKGYGSKNLKFGLLRIEMTISFSNSFFPKKSIREPIKLKRLGATNRYCCPI